MSFDNKLSTRVMIMSLKGYISAHAYSEGFLPFVESDQVGSRDLTV